MLVLTMKAKCEIALFFIQLLFVCECHYIQKCCDRRETLTRNFDTCIDYDGSIGIEKYETNNESELDGIHLVKVNKNDSHHIWWLPLNLQFATSRIVDSKLKVRLIPYGNLTDLKFLYNSKYPCDSSEVEIIPFTEHVFILENGSLLITNNVNNVQPRTMMFPSSSYCLDRVSLINMNRKQKRSSNIIDHSFAILLCPCLYMPCVRMCCPWKHYLNFSEVQEKCVYSSNISLKWNLRYKDDAYEEQAKLPEQYSIIQNVQECKHGHYHLNENSSSSKKFWVLPDGNINAEELRYNIKFKDYCIHYWHVNGTFQNNLRICKTPEEDWIREFEHMLYGCYFTIGAIFLALTLLVYGVVNDLRTTVYAYYLIAHVCCLFICTFTMAINEFFWYTFSRNFCIAVAYVIQFSFISAMFWLNVMCKDISDTFKGHLSPNKFNLPETGKVVFVRNSIYVWGTALIITFITIIADNTRVMNEQYRPHFGAPNCWFAGVVAKLIYFYLPISVVIVYNTYLFLSTTRQIFKVQRDSSKCFNQDSNRHLGTNSFRKDTHQLKLFAKLFGVMGLTWIFEILSLIIGGPSYYWYFTDAINALRGLFIFIIFCCKKKILFAFCGKLPKIPKKIRSNSTVTSSTGASHNTNSIQLELFGPSNQINETSLGSRSN